MKTRKKDLTAFSQRLTEGREGKSFSQNFLAGLVGISKYTLNRYENIKAVKEDKNGSRSNPYPSIDVAYKIATALDVSLDWLYGVSDNKVMKSHNAVDMLHFITKAIEGNIKPWQVVVDVVKPHEDESVEEQVRAMGTSYRAAICIDDVRFKGFIQDYERALRAGTAVVDDYKQPEKIAEDMKNYVLDEYIKKFKNDRGDEE
jgi:transcriptional regulator with XRE-family HTH domain